MDPGEMGHIQKEINNSNPLIYIHWGCPISPGHVFFAAK